MVSIAESLRTWANDTKESLHGEPVLNKNRFSIPIPTCQALRLRSQGGTQGGTESNVGAMRHRSKTKAAYFGLVSVQKF